MSALMATWLTPTSLFVILNIMIGTIFLISRLSPPKTVPHHQQVGHDDGGYNSAPPVLLQRAPSLLERVKSINFSTYKFPFPNQDIIDVHHLQHDNLAAHPLERSSSILERVKSINFSLYKFSPQNPNNIQQTEHDYTNPKPLSRTPSFLERVKTSIDFTSFYRSDSIKSNQQTESLTTDQEADSDTDVSQVHGQVKRSKSEPSKVIQRKLPEKMKKSASENSRHKAEDEDEDEATLRIEKTIGDDGGQGVDAKADDFINKFKQQLKLERWDSFLRYKDMLMGK